MSLDAIISNEMVRCRAAPTGDLLDVLEAYVLDGGLSDAEIRHRVFTLIGAGSHTTAASLAWMAWARTTSTPKRQAALSRDADIHRPGPFPQRPP